jgi:hypothetical protein
VAAVITYVPFVMGPPCGVGSEPDVHWSVTGALLDESELHTPPSPGGVGLHGEAPEEDPLPPPEEPPEPPPLPPPEELPDPPPLPLPDELLEMPPLLPPDDPLELPPSSPPRTALAPEHETSPTKADAREKKRMACRMFAGIGITLPWLGRLRY